MDVYRLLGDELTYELYVRGQPIGNTVAEKRVALGHILREERENPQAYVANVYLECSDELRICAQKLNVLEADIRNYDHQNRENEYRRINSRIIHLSLRLGRLTGTNVDDEIWRLRLVNKCSQLMGDNSLLHQGINITQVADNPAALLQNSRDSFGREVRNAMNGGDHISLLDTRTPVLTVDPPLLPSPEEIPIGSLVELGPRDEEVAHVKRVASRWSEPLFREAGSYDQILRDYASAIELPRAVSSPLADVDGRRFAPTLGPYYKRLLEEPREETFMGNTFRPSSTRVCLNPEESGTESQYSRRATIGDRTPSLYSRLAIFGDSTPTFNRETAQVDTMKDLNAEMAKISIPGMQHPSLGQEPNVNRYDMYRWNVKFNGKTSVNEFLQRVEELRASRGVPREMLLRWAPEFFAQEALLWYRTRTFNSWDDLVDQLKESFRPFDYEYSLWDEIRKRTQGAHEKVLTYIVAMENLFGKLDKIPQEEEKVNLIRRNLLPYLQTGLALHKITRLEDLLKLSRLMEETERRVQKFIPPSTAYKSLLEPELAYHKPQGLGPIQQSVTAISSSTSAPPSEVGKPSIIKSQGKSSQLSKPSCWNCLAETHKFKACSQPLKKFCFKCGNPDTVSYSCTRCSKNGGRSQK